MTKEKQITLKISLSIAEDIYGALYQSQLGHSFEFATDRVKNIRNVMDMIASQSDLGSISLIGGGGVGIESE